MPSQVVDRALRQEGTNPPPHSALRPLEAEEPSSASASASHPQSQGLRGSRRPIQLVALHSVEKIIYIQAAPNRLFHGHPQEDQAHASGAPFGVETALIEI